MDSDEIISTPFEKHIYGLFLGNHNPADPIDRKDIMNTIEDSENKFIIELKENPKSYIAALGPNVHIRSEWKSYYNTVKPHVIFLKADVNTVYDALRSREDRMADELKDNNAFGNWNHGVTRMYNAESGKYEELPEDLAKRNIASLINVNEAEYVRIADITLEASTLSDRHENYSVNALNEFFTHVKTLLNQNS